MKASKLCIVLLLSLLLQKAQSQELEHTLLWRITGKQLKSPSYLYGTIHIQNKKVFNFPDSLYAAIDQCPAFALEFNPDSLNSGLSDYLTNEFAKESSRKRKAKKLKELLAKSDLDELQSRLGKEGKINAGELTVKQAYVMKEKFLSNKKKEDDMPTFMDAFLYKIAKDKDKTMEGLEPLNFEMSVLDDVTEKDGEAKAFVENIRKTDNSLELLIKMYLEKDINKIHKWSETMPSSFENKVIIARNKKMVLVMDSIMQHQSLFSAAGAAHLPGDTGLIVLLRRMGYTVEPVLCNTFTHATKYVFSKKEQPWVDVVDTTAGYLVKMPSMPSDIKVMGGIMKMKTFVDLTTNQGYYTMHIASATFAVKGAKDSMMGVMAKSMTTSTNGINIVEKPVKNGGVDGKEYDYEGKGKIYYRLQLLIKGNDLFMLLSNSMEKVNTRIDSFFSSFKVLPKFKLTWSQKTFEDDYFSIYTPGPKPKPTIDYDGDSTYFQQTYTAVDETVGAYYFVYISKTTKGYNFMDDSSQIEGIEKRMGEKVVHFERKVINTPHYTADEYEGVQAKGVMYMGRMIYSGNRLYDALVIYPDNNEAKADAKSFLESIQLLPVPSSSNSLQTAPDTTFKTFAPAPFLKVLPKKKETGTDSSTTASADDSLIHYRSYDEKRLINYDVFKKKLSHFYWNSIDTATLSKWIRRNKEEGETVSDIHFSNVGKVLVAEATMTKPRSAQQHRVKVFGLGHTRYTLTSLIPAYAIGDKSIDSVYSKFTVLAQDNNPLASSPTAFIAALHSTDSATYTDAVKQSEDVFFGKSDIPYLLKEFPSKFTLDSTDNYGASNLLLDVIYAYPDDISVDDVAQLYLKMPEDRGKQKFTVLKFFTKLKDTTAAYAKLQSLMLTNTPVNGYGYGLYDELVLHPNRTKIFFPAWFKLTKDSSVSSIVCKLAKKLVDSGYLSMDSIRNQFPLILANSRAILKEVTPDNNYTGTVELLSLFDTAEGWNEIKKFQYASDNYVKRDAVKLLVKKKIEPDAAIIDTLAADKVFRIGTYNELLDSNMLYLFPKRFLNQRSFAESHLYNSNEDDGYGFMKYIGDKSIKYNGKTQKFYLFEVKYSKGDKNSYLGVVGPYSNSSSQFFIGDDDDDATGVYATEALNGRQPDSFIKAYFKDLEEKKKNRVVDTEEK